jgi:hypothetical protein
MCSAKPISFLPEMALSAELIAVVEVNLFTLFVHQGVTVFWMMAFHAGQIIISLPMVHGDVPVGEQRTIIYQNFFFFIMAGGAAIPLQVVFTGQDLEFSALEGFLGPHRLVGKGVSGFDLTIIKRFIGFQDSVGDRTLTGQGTLA